MNKNSLVVDLHMHSTSSDGVLSPSALVDLNAENHVDIMALTDHDTLEGLPEAREAANRKGIRFINGVEMTASWEKKVLHIIALDFDPENLSLKQSLEDLKLQRLDRAERIAKKLQNIGIPGSLAGAQKYAREGLITRPHFAQFLVEAGKANDPQEAFDRYLGRKKKAWVATEWPPMEKVIDTIHHAGGLAVLAHPLRYKLTASWMYRLLTAFKKTGGEGMEVVCGYYTPIEIKTSVGFALRFDLMGSVGSDFHGHSLYNNQPGTCSPLPDSLTPIWSLFKDL